MKKLLLALIFVIASQSALKASHVLGGEIRWECLSTGRFIFFAKVFRDCTGIPYPFDNKTLEIVGSPLPRSSTNATISSILLKPDSTTWAQNRFGDTSPECAPGGDVITCGDEDEGAIQQFFFQSDPIQLKGRPPSGGWKFYLVQPCCRPNVTNLATGGNMMLRAIMYPDADNNTVDDCKDSSPEFLALPTNMICRGYEFTYNHTAIDQDLDSLVYGWDRTYNTPPIAPQPVPYANGFNFNNPTPDRTFNTQNIPSTLDPVTGQISVGVWSGIGAKDYLTVVRVDAWRDGRVIASVFREIPFVFFDCPRLPNTQINQPPQIFIDGDSADGLIVDIVAGQQVRIPFQATDLDAPGGVPGLQRVTVEPAGFMFSKDLQDPQFCYYPPPPGENASCAYLRNQDPVFNGTVEPPRFQISGFAGVATEFVWDTKCHHVSDVTNTGIPGTNEGIFNFVMRTYDDHCPIPGINYPTITVKVRDPFPLEQPIMKGLSVNLDGSVTHQWIPPLDSATNFYKYKVQSSTPGNNFNPTQYLNLDTNERRYGQERRTTAFRIYRPMATNPNVPDMMNPVDDKDFYLRMQTVSGCERDVPSVWNQPARAIEVGVTPSGDAGEPGRSEATMNWNAPVRPNHFYHPYFKYVSQTKYYIWTNDNITADPANPGTYSGLANPNNWLLRGDTYNRSYEVGSTTCSGWVAFRVEARDTIITYKQGTAPRQDTLDTLYFSTFSVIDTMFMKNPGFIPNPKFDTVEVRDNGDIFVRVDAGNAGTTGEYEIYFGTVDPNNLQGVITKPDDSLLISGASGQAGPIDVIMRAIDDCDSTNTANSNVYETFIPSGSYPADPCAGYYDLNWVNPGGFPNGTRGYRIYRRVRSQGMPNFTAWELIQTVSGANNTSAAVPIVGNTDYRFKVVAYDDQEDVIISGIHNLSVDDIRTYEVVPAPELRCSYVEDNGNVTLSFLPADPSRGPEFDSTGNWVAYRFQYSLNGGNWVDVNGSAGVPQDTNSITITGIDAIANSYQFRATSISGCDGATPAPYSEINLIEPIATAIPNDIEKRVRIEWTGTGVVSNERDLLFKTYGLNNYYGGPRLATLDDALSDSYVDNTNSGICDSIAYFSIVKEDQLSGCLNRSRPDSARIRDLLPPPPQLLDYLSYEVGPSLGTETNFNSDVYSTRGELELSWSIKPSSDTKYLMIFSPDSSTSQNDSINTVRWNERIVKISRDRYNADDTSYVMSAQSIDSCGRKALNFNEFDYHRSIDIDVEFNPCDSAMELSWTKYDTFQMAGAVEYVVETMRLDSFLFQDAAGNDSIGMGLYDVQELGITDLLTYEHKIDEDKRRYAYRVYARPQGSNGLRAYSNWDSLTADFGALPQYNYISYATVLPTKEVELQLFKDSTIKVGGYTLYRAEGVDSSALTPIAKVAPVSDTSLITTEDNTARTDQLSYLYQMVVENVCGNPIDTTNVATTIHLTVKPDNEALTNTLYWNEYQGWDSTVAFYNIYRGYNGDPAEDLYATVPATDEAGNQFIDDVYDNAYSIGNYCYRVEAVQGNLNPDYADDLNPATSASNEVCVTQKPLFYVPNAFSPTGVNRVFGPTGQFFDFTLFEMTIYNRWGELIFETRDIAKGWDGTVNGEPAPLGSYVYAIRFVDADGEEHRRKGTVTLIK